jgi:outer membrane protein assembly factor BamB
MGDILSTGEGKMRKNSQFQLKILVGIFCIFLIMPVTAQCIGINGIIQEEEGKNIDKNFPQNEYHLSEIKYLNECPLDLFPIHQNMRNQIQKIFLSTIPTYGNFLNHPWPMQGYNREHLGRSPYSTINNPGIEKWRFPGDNWCDGSPVVGSDGTIYFGDNTFLCAIYPNGSIKWRCRIEQGIGDFGSSPAIADDGTIYVGTTFGSYIYAINPDGTEKWKFWGPEIDTSININDDGVIYYGHHEGVTARYPNGTIKWVFHTGDFVQSTPAIDDNGIIYFGSHDYHVYSVYPNGTMKWSFSTGNWVHGSPTIGFDGMIYVGSDDNYLYALYPNGTMKWRVMVGGMRASPSLDKEGNLYFGVWESKILSVSPEGVIRWEFVLGNRSGVWGSTAAVSDDGTVYVGVSIDIDMLGGGEIIALNANGTLKWRKIVSDQLVRSSAVIGADGTVYICSSESGWHDIWGHLHAFGPVTSNVPPNTPIITGPAKGHIHDYTSINISATDDDNNPVSYFIEWGEGNTSGWTKDYGSGETLKYSHIYSQKGTYTIRVKARDTFGAESNWGTFTVKEPINNNAIDFPWLLSLFERFFERYPHAFPLLRHLFGQ